MKLHSPVTITPRLMAGVQLGTPPDLSFVSIEYAGDELSGRTRYHYYIDTPDEDYDNDDLRSGCQGGDLRDGLESLLGFLGAAGEAYGFEQRTGLISDNDGLFPPEIMEWCYRNSDELSMLQCEVEENKECIEED